MTQSPSIRLHSSMTTLLHNHSFATEHVPLRAQLTCPTMFPDSLGNACDRPQLPMDLSQLCAECTWLTVLPDLCGSTYCGHFQLLNQLCARCTFIDSFRGSASLHPPCLSFPVDDVSAEVHILHRNINRAISATHHSAQPTLGCLTRHSPPSAASLGTAYPRLPHSAQPTLGCLTRHSPPSAASLGTAHPRLPHSAQPTLGCLTRHSPPSAASLGTAHPRLPHSAQPTLGCLTRHSPPSAASLGTAHSRLPHSAQPTLGCLTRHSPPSAASLGTAHPRLPHTRHSLPSAASPARPQQGSATFSGAAFIHLSDAVTNHVYADASDEYSVTSPHFILKLMYRSSPHWGGSTVVAWDSILRFESSSLHLPSLSLSTCGAHTLSRSPLIVTL